MSFLNSPPLSRVESALVETNQTRTRRELFWVARGLRNVMGLPWFSSYPEEANMHWGLRLGPYLWELAANKKAGGLIVKNRSPKEEWWEPELGPIRVAEGTWTDAHVDHCAQHVIELMRERYKDVQKREYHITNNNCQIFIKVLDHMLQNNGEQYGIFNLPPYSKVTYFWTRDEWDQARLLPNAHPKMDTERSRDIREFEIKPYQRHIGIDGPFAARRRKSSLSAAKYPLIMLTRHSSIPIPDRKINLPLTLPGHLLRDSRISLATISSAMSTSTLTLEASDDSLRRHQKAAITFRLTDWEHPRRIQLTDEEEKHVEAFCSFVDKSEKKTVKMG